MRAPPGTRLEETERIYAEVEKAIQQDIPPDEIDTLLDNIGIPNSGINLSLSDGSLMSSADGEILISLKEGHRPTEEYQDKLARDLRNRVSRSHLLLRPGRHRDPGAQLRHRRPDRRPDRGQPEGR